MTTNGSTTVSLRTVLRWQLILLSGCLLLGLLFLGSVEYFRRGRPSRSLLIRLRAS